MVCTSIMGVSMYLIVISIVFAGGIRKTTGACTVGFWGEDCKRKCAKGCYFGYGCDEDNGVCSRCMYGFYGPHCDSKCSENCVQCDQETGLCTSCEYSWYGDLCTKRCSSNCVYCDISDGECNSCKHGYWGTYCEKECLLGDECLYNCDTGSNSSVCQYACKCVYCSKYSGSCSSCAAGFWGPGCFRQCPQNCSRCYFSYGGCYNCDNGYWGNDCQYKCPETCMTCQSGRQCTVCKTGHWGSSCERRCSRCASCNSYYGYCTECRHGYWGSSCNNKCPDGCSCCDMNSGTCIENDCQPKNVSKSDNCIIVCCNINNDECIENGCVPNVKSKEGTDTEPEQDNTLTIIGISMIGIGFVLSVICVTLVLVIIRRMKNSQQNGGKNTYEGSQHQTGCQNDLELYENPSY